eukprot:scaffold648947_cov36-Prasinocladus_malaysianus.AAC.1
MRRLSPRYMAPIWMVSARVERPMYVVEGFHYDCKPWSCLSFNAGVAGVTGQGPGRGPAKDVGLGAETSEHRRPSTGRLL